MPCTAQVVGICSGRLLYVAVYDIEPRADPASSDEWNRIHGADMVLIGLTMDARIRHGLWQVVARAPVSQRVWLPGHLLVPAPGRYVVVDHTGKRERPATGLDTARVRFRTTVSPMELELAAQARFGRGAWEPGFDELLPANQVPEVELFPTGQC